MGRSERCFIFAKWIWGGGGRGLGLRLFWEIWKENKRKQILITMNDLFLFDLSIIKFLSFLCDISFLLRVKKALLWTNQGLTPHSLFSTPSWLLSFLTLLLHFVLVCEDWCSFQRSVRYHKLGLTHCYRLWWRKAGLSEALRVTTHLLLRISDYFKWELLVRITSYFHSLQLTPPTVFTFKCQDAFCVFWCSNHPKMTLKIQTCWSCSVFNHFWPCYLHLSLSLYKCQHLIVCVRVCVCEWICVGKRKRGKIVC